jgi:hypothetical protein
VETVYDDLLNLADRLCKTMGFNRNAKEIKTAKDSLLKFMKVCVFCSLPAATPILAHSRMIVHTFTHLYFPLILHTTHCRHLVLPTHTSHHPLSAPCTQEGIRFALEKPIHLVFLDAMKHYLKLFQDKVGLCSMANAAWSMQHGLCSMICAAWSVHGLQ